MDVRIEIRSSSVIMGYYYVWAIVNGQIVINEAFTNLAAAMDATSRAVSRRIEYLSLADD